MAQTPTARSPPWALRYLLWISTGLPTQPDYSGVIPAALTIFPHFATSLRRNTA